MTKSSYVVQGVSIHLFSENHLHPLISNFFNSLYRGKKRFEIKPLEFELYMVEEPPLLPANSIRAIKFPSLTFYSSGKEIYFTSKDGSIVCLNTITRIAKGFLKREILEDSVELSSLVGSPVVETLKYHGIYSIHSAALYGNGMGCLVSGSSGCGKTSTSLSLVTQGFKYVSDDFLVFEELNEEIFVHPFYKSFNLDRDLAERFPEVVGGKNLPIPEGTKVSVDISQIFPDSFIPHLRPDVIIFPKITSNGKSGLNPLSLIEVYSRLLKQTVLAVDKEVARNQLKALEKLVKQTLGFELLSGRDIYEDPKKLASLIRRLKSQNGNREILPSKLGFNN